MEEGMDRCENLLWVDVFGMRRHRASSFGASGSNCEITSPTFQRLPALPKADFLIKTSGAKG